MESGSNPLPVQTADGWQHRRITAETASRYFNGATTNIGVQMGTASNGLTDVDLDCDEALTIAPYLLPTTNSIFGRPSKRNSHRLYITDLASAYNVAAIQLKDPKTKGMMLERRIGGGDRGAQTVFPASTHEEGEAVAWERGLNGEPAAVDGLELERKVRLVAACALMARYWPANGSHGRHAAALVAGGFLARCGHHRSLVKVYVEAIAKAARDEDVGDRRKAAEDAAVA